MFRSIAFVTALGHGIGQVLDTLKACGGADNTVVFFMSDNGSFRMNRKGLDVGINDPLRSGGVTCWEGGIRVVAMARWPGKNEPASIINEPFWSPDIMTACAELSGTSLSAGIVFDGKDPLPLLTSGAKSEHKSFFFTFRKHAALRKGDWKIVRERPDEPWQLFDLKNDPAEAENLAAVKKGRLLDPIAEFDRWE